jgi:aryl sulfotransferase
MRAMAGSFHPVKTREMHNHHMDSTRWNEFDVRDGDVVVATYAKSGTTWMQQIVTQLVFNGDPDADLTNSPWLDLRIAPRDEVFAMLAEQTNRRVVKTHLPIDALTFSPKARYLYVARDGRDLVWSFHNHLLLMEEEVYEALNTTPGRVGPEILRPSPDVYQFFQDWMDRDGYPIWPFWEHVRGWWEARNVANIRLVHFNELKRDLPGMIGKLADFLEFDIDEPRWNQIVEHCTFDYMKENAAQIFPLAEKAFQGGARTFVNKGTNQRWKDVLTEEDNRRYLETARRELGEDCAHWLETGQMPA